MVFLGFYNLYLIPTTRNYSNQSNKNSSFSYSDIQLPVYKFNNPSLAFDILKQLEIDNFIDENKLNHHKMHLKAIYDNHYCEKSLKKFISHPEIIFDQRNIFSDYSSSSLIRQIIRQDTNDLHPDAVYYKPSRLQTPFSFSNDIGMYYLQELFHKNAPIGQKIACSHQLYNKLLNISSLSNKGKATQSYENYLIKYEKRPQCIERGLPESFVLWDPSTCKNFFAYLDSEEYKNERIKSVVFIQKFVEQHMGIGVSMLDSIEEEKLKSKYQNGKLCSKKKEAIQIQRYIQNPLLLYGHKFDFRIYMLIASVDPLIVYYHDGILRVSLQKFKLDSKDKTTHFTNTHLAEGLFELARKEGKWDGMTETQLKDFQTWNFTRFQDYLMEVGHIQDSNWLENYLRPKIKTILIHLLRSTSHDFTKRSNLFKLWGMDFMIDDNLKLWFIEANTKPAIKGPTPVRKLFIETMVRDMFDLMFAYLRSRMKRVILYVNYLSKEISEREGYVVVPNLEANRMIFKTKININSMDPQFEPKNTTFQKIIDENLNGDEIYGGLIPNECL